MANFGCFWHSGRDSNPRPMAQKTVSAVKKKEKVVFITNKEKAKEFLSRLPKPYKDLEDQELKKLISITNTYLYKKITKKKEVN